MSEERTNISDTGWLRSKADWIGLGAFVAALGAFLYVMISDDPSRIAGYVIAGSAAVNFGVQIYLRVKGS